MGKSQILIRLLNKRIIQSIQTDKQQQILTKHNNKNQALPTANSPINRLLINQQINIRKINIYTVMSSIPRIATRTKKNHINLKIWNFIFQYLKLILIVILNLNLNLNLNFNLINSYCQIKTLFCMIKRRWGIVVIMWMGMLEINTWLGLSRINWGSKIGNTCMGRLLLIKLA